MDNKLFADLCESVGQAGLIVRGEISASLSFSAQNSAVEATGKSSNHSKTYSVSKKKAPIRGGK